MGIVAYVWLLVGCAEEFPPEDDGLEHVSLGTVTTDADGRVELEVDVSDTAVSALLHCGPYGFDRLARVTRLVAPDGVVVADEGVENPSFRSDAQADHLRLLLPWTPEVPIAAGTWVATVTTDAPSTSLTCGVVTRVDAAADAATLDLRVVFVGADAVLPGLNAVGGEETLADVLDALRSLWAPAGLTLGAVVWEDYAGDRASHAVVEDEAELGALLRSTPADIGRSVPVFVVESILDGAGASVSSTSAGAPGAPTVGGTSASGVAIAAGDVASDPDRVARAIAHEVGHFLGLFDTSDRAGAVFDPLLDTPECNPSSDADGNGALTADECVGKGADNVMWWANSLGADTFTDDQAWVLRQALVAR